MPRHETEALKLPDPLLVRFYREGIISQITAVELDAERNVTVTMEGGAVHRFQNLPDVGWVPVEG